MNISSASVAAYERINRLEKRSSNHRPFTIVLMALFFLLLIAALAVGARVYGSVVSQQTSGNAIRIQTGMLQSAVHANDARDAVFTRQGPEGTALILVETLSTGTYETRVYLFQGQVCIEYAPAGNPYNPETATPLFASDTFEATVSDGVVHISTDVGPLDLAVRSMQGGGA